MNQIETNLFSNPVALVVAFVFAMNAFGPHASAHSVSQIRGSAVVKDDRIAVSFEISGEDILHIELLGRMVNSTVRTDDIREAVMRFASRLRNEFAVYGEAGRRLSVIECKAVERNFDTPTVGFDEFRQMPFAFSIVFGRSNEDSLLTFRQLIGRLDSGLRLRLMLSVESDGNGALHQLMLTNGGNAESAAIVSPGTMGDVSTIATKSSFDENAFTEITAKLIELDASAQLEIRIPLPLLATWMDSDTAPDGAVKRSDVQRLVEFGKRVVNDRVTVEPDKSSEVSSEWTVNIIDGWGRAVDDVSPDTSLSYWTTRVVYRLSLPKPSERPFLMHYQLFNPSVLATDISYASGNGRRRCRVSGLEPWLHFGHDSKGELVLWVTRSKY